MFIGIILGVTGIMTAAAAYLGFFQDRSRGRPRCPKCWYNMTGAPSLVCPECGHDAQHRDHFFHTRRRPWAIRCAILLTICWAYLWQARTRMVEFHETFVSALKPTTYLLLNLSDANVSTLYGRFRSSGSRFWPWESWLVLKAYNLQLAAPRPPAQGPDFFLQSLLDFAARNSKPALDKLIELGLREIDRSYVDQYGNRLTFHSRLTAAKFTRRMTDSELSGFIDLAIKDEEGATGMGSLDWLMAEAVRRHSPEFREKVAHAVAVAPKEGMLLYRGNLEQLTALRRMDGQSDPLRMTVAEAPVVTCKGSLPTLHVKIQNVDIVQETVGLQRGGDGGARWRCVVKDQDGQTLPMKQDFRMRREIHGDLRNLFFGEIYESELDMNDYVQPLAPGHYRVVLLYNNRTSAYEAEDAPNRILLSSDPFELIVDKP